MLPTILNSNFVVFMASDLLIILQVLFVNHIQDILMLLQLQ